LETKIQKELQFAKANATKNQKSAMMALKRKKAYTSQVEKLNGARTTLETQIMAIENATTNFATLNAMTEGARTLRGLNRNMDVDDVEETMEDIREQMEIAEEISTAVATPIGMDILDEEDLEKELNDLVTEEVDKQFEGVTVPTTQPVGEKPVAAPAAARTDEEEFEALGAEMGIM